MGQREEEERKRLQREKKEKKLQKEKEAILKHEKEVERLLERLKALEADKADEKKRQKILKSFKFKQGTKVYAKYGKKYYLGKINKCRINDKSYDILFDDGDTRNAVPESEIRTVEEEEKR